MIIFKITIIMIIFNITIMIITRSPNSRDGSLLLPDLPSHAFFETSPRGPNLNVIIKLIIQECGVLAFNVQRREQNFSRMLAFIFLRSTFHLLNSGSFLFNHHFHIPQYVFIIKIDFSYVLCTFPALILHLNEHSSTIFPTSWVPIWVGGSDWSNWVN